MSIPPLVCSTPPPPDQCEDDKDPEDFDLSYNNLSQEEEDDENNDYNYGNFSSYNRFQSASDDKPLGIKDQEMTRSLDSEENKEIFIQYDSKETEQTNAGEEVFRTNDINENKLKCEEDINIEDLNLKVDEEIATHIVDNSDENESSDQNTDSSKDLNIPCHSNNSSQYEDNTNISSFENVIDHTAGVEISHVDLDESIVEQSSAVKTKQETIADDVEKNYAKSQIESNEPSRTEETSEISEEFPEEFQQSKTFKVLSNENLIDDDFGEFDDFQFVNTKKNLTTVVVSSNPWENTDTNESDFGNFTANFEENKFHTQDSSPLATHFVSNSQQLENQVIVEEGNLDDDEFEDFDEFKSSAVNPELNEVLEEEPCHELPVLNLHSTDNEHHIMESITKVLTSVFIEEISEPNAEFKGKLESLLSETWGHLMETDERQPYIVNWNNSLGQKTLLKALCIDSRNILFGPKWSSHMPKYAANLSNAPLQPQKQACTPTNLSQSEIVGDKTSSKLTTWSDPFTSDGQEFTYAEALLLDLEHLMATLDQMAHNHSTLKISELLSHACNTETESSTVTPRPTDLDVFEAAMSNKSEKLYSNALSVQPIRQINLPDTHIFTPTDSEIPRSKTIHYDRTPTVLLPQPVCAINQIPADNMATQNKNSVVETNTKHDNEYWEFQDFKSTSDSRSLPGSVSQPQIPLENNIKTATNINVLPNSNIAYQTQLLQPIKVESSMPTLNWPDPGEIKGPYDDFSDFVSISSQSMDKQDGGIIQDPKSQMETNNIIRSNNLNDLNENTEEVFAEPVKLDNEGFVDDFDTFKSALPSKSVPSDFKTSTFGSTANQTPSGRFTDLDYASSKSNSIKCDTISFATLPRPSEALSQNLDFVSNTTEVTNKSLTSGTQIQCSLLQPTPTSFSAVNTQNQRTTGQILQPLSLESYSQINWPSPGIDLQDLSRFNPVETLQSLKNDLNVGGLSKSGSPVHTQKNTTVNQTADDDVWGEFVSSKPKQQQSLPKKPGGFAEDDEWTDFISSPSVKPQNGLNTISFNVHTNSHIQKTVQNKFAMKNNQASVDIPTLNYITPKTNSHKSYNDKHFQNL